MQKYSGPILQNLRGLAIVWQLSLAPHINYRAETHHIKTIYGLKLCFLQILFGHSVTLVGQFVVKMVNIDINVECFHFPALFSTSINYIVFQLVEN